MFPSSILVSLLFVYAVSLLRDLGLYSGLALGSIAFLCASPNPLLFTFYRCPFSSGPCFGLRCRYSVPYPPAFPAALMTLFQCFGLFFFHYMPFLLSRVTMCPYFLSLAICPFSADEFILFPHCFSNPFFDVVRLPFLTILRLLSFRPYEPFFGLKPFFSLGRCACCSFDRMR